MTPAITDILIVLAILFSGSAFVLMLKRDMMMLQQNSYRYDRFRTWMEQSGESTTMPRLVAIIVVLLAASTLITPLVRYPLMFLYGLWTSIDLARKKYKKPLVFTPRAVRIFVVSILLSVLVCTICFHMFFDGYRLAFAGIAFGFTACCAVSYVFPVIANFLLVPLQRHIDRGYYKDAERILASMPELKIIGITGSYGKTSSKHFLHAILRERYEIVMTPGNFNTTLGVIRTIREHLKPYTEVFIVEMGAKQKGDIKEICDLVHPTMGIITAVGPQHLESFKTIETVRDTKFELADSLPADGLVLVNNDFPMIAGREVKNCRCLRYAIDNKEAAGYFVTEVEYSPKGTTFKICNAEGEVMSLHTRLLGSANISDLAAAAILAMETGMTKEQIAFAVERIAPVEHRLSTRHTASGITLLDDAYNSNPVGSAMALEVLSHMRQGRRIVITPGMIELGTDQERLNREFGRNIAKSVDIAVIVGQYNRDAILAGIEEGEGNPQTEVVDTFAQGQRYLNAIMRRGDTILYENDLPDTFK